MRGWGELNGWAGRAEWLGGLNEWLGRADWLAGLNEMLGRAEWLGWADQRELSELAPMVEEGLSELNALAVMGPSEELLMGGLGRAVWGCCDGEGLNELNGVAVMGVSCGVNGGNPAGDRAVRRPDVSNER